MLSGLHKKDIPSGFEVNNIQLSRLYTIGDGNCFLHAVSACCLESYRNQAYNEKGIFRTSNRRLLEQQVRDLRVSILEFFLTNNMYLPSEREAKEFLERVTGYAGDYYIKDGETSDERFLNRIFSTPMILGKKVYSKSGRFRKFIEPRGIVLNEETERYEYIRDPTLKYELRDNYDGGKFIPYIHLKDQDKESILQEFRNKEFKDPTGVFNLKYSVKAIYKDEEGNSLIPSYNSVAYLSREGNLLINMYDQGTSITDAVKFFTGDDYFASEYINITALTLNINIIIIDRTSAAMGGSLPPPSIFIGQDYTRPWIILVLSGNVNDGHYEACGIFRDNKLQTIFGHEDPVVRSLVEQNNQPLPFTFFELMDKVEIFINDE